MKEVQDIIGKEETRELKAEMNDMLSTGEATYEDLEDLLNGYGLEPDNIECLLGF